MRLSLRTLRWVAIIVPFAFLAGFDYLRHFVFPAPLHSWPGYIGSGVIILVGIVIFATLIFDLVERMEAQVLRKTEQLRALHDAGIAVTAELSLEAVLQKVVDLSRQLVQARYGALGVIGQDGRIKEFFSSGLSPEEQARLSGMPKGLGLLGRLVTEGKPIRVADTAKHPAAVGFPPDHPPMKTFIGVPIISKGKIIGSLYLTERRGGGEFSQEDEEALVLLAAQASIAIENARLYQQVQRLAVLEERERIGMDLHDGVIQSIYAVGLGLEDTMELAGTYTEGRERLDRAIRDLNQVIRDIRAYIYRLSPQPAWGRGLVSNLTELIDAAKMNALVDAHLEIEGEPPTLSQDQTEHLVHIAQEALANIIKHARANAVTVRLAADNDSLHLAVADDGVGFKRVKASQSAGMGLRNMAERARALGGQLTVESDQGQGTTITVDVPIGVKEEMKSG
ncbi:MAG: GAF domain-containing sensor histidine kinase [Chloroflexi bacterium]|nr:GAF domain-containing sensor histidine kinase [Chloroflexota bacterium]